MSASLLCQITAFGHESTHEHVRHPAILRPYWCLNWLQLTQRTAACWTLICLILTSGGASAEHLAGCQRTPWSLESFLRDLGGTDGSVAGSYSPVAELKSRALCLAYFRNCESSK